MLKKIITIVAIFFLILTYSYSIDFSMGPKIGINLNHFLGKDHKDEIEYQEDVVSFWTGNWEVKNHMAPGLSGGMFFRIHFRERIIMQTELFFETRKAGFKIKNSDDNQDWRTYNYRYFLLDLPIMACFKFKDFSVFFGPNVLFKLGNTQYVSYNNESDERDIRYLSNDNQKVVTFGIVGGIGYEFQLKKGYLLLDARYNLLLNSFDDFGSPNNDDRKINSITFGVGYGFNL